MKRAITCVTLLTATILLTSCYPPALALKGTEKMERSATNIEHRILLPLATGSGISYRTGFGGLPKTPESAEAVTAMRAGWYFSWWVYANPLRPNGIEYVQLINLHQKLTCPLRSADAHDRSKCPYAQPLDYVVSPDRATIATAARRNPKSLWLIGNEMDIRDSPGGGQNEMLPETYAVAFHDLYTLVKSNDPRAKVAIGGVVQPSPLRLDYLAKIWDAYRARYGAPMPVDVWNVHNYILSESASGSDAGVPPGSAAEKGVVYSAADGGDSNHVNMAIFDRQIRAMRAWMRDRGQQNKPLIVSEYGILFKHIPEADTPEKVQDFMAATTEYFLRTKDCSLGYPADECRLVQRWAWYSLDNTTGFNPYIALFDPSKKAWTSTGQRFRDCAMEAIIEGQEEMFTGAPWVECRDPLASKQ